MVLKEIVYTVLEYMRQGSIVDDERMDVRLIESMVHIKRADYLRQLKDSGRQLPNIATQSTTLSLSELLNTGNEITLKSQALPAILSYKNGHCIEEISSPDISQYPFNVIDYRALRVCGNGKFNKDQIFCAYFDKYIFAKSKNSGLNALTSCNLWAVFETPTDVPGFNVLTDEYPIDLQGIDAIKESIFKMDVRLFMGGVTDEVNDSSGEIKQ